MFLSVEVSLNVKEERDLLIFATTVWNSWGYESAQDSLYKSVRFFLFIVVNTAILSLVLFNILWLTYLLLSF